ncbi:S-layer homology domain-containing protein [Lysinibacillus sp. UGB7]|uniref:S-layer homology domain-containing protein n=1 Tax=Lysinibacillus sp. UGB7 TaxID=3411039 RepID=UPI003B7B0943
MKKILTSIITLILVVAFALPEVSAKDSQVFEDVPATHPNFNDINYLVEQGVLEKESVYRPTDLITREEAIVMIAKAIGLDGTLRETKFEDVPKSNVNSGYIQSAAEAGIIYGVNVSTLKPNSNLTRLQMSLMLVRAFKLPLEEKVPEGTKLFKDVSWSWPDSNIVQSVANSGITTGYSDGTFKPYNSLTRGHMAAFLTRAMKYVENNS